MNKSLLTGLIFLLLNATVKAQPEPVEFTYLTNYTLKNEVKLGSGINCFVVNNLPQFNKTFVAPKTAGSAAAGPNFGSQRVIAAAMAPTMRDTKLIIQKVEMAGNTLNVHCVVQYGNNLTYKVKPLQVVSVQRASFIKRIAFYRDGRMIKLFAVR
jgi:hypothetical protein